MSEPVRVKVQMLDYAEPHNRGRCPIAFALKLSDLDILSPKVDDEFVVFSRRSTDLRYEYWTPDKAVKWLKDYDAGRQPKPFYLKLDDTLLHSTRPRAKVQGQQVVNDWVRSKDTTRIVKKRRSPNLRGS